MLDSEREGMWVKSDAVGDYVRELRNKKGWSQQRLATEIGAHRSYVNQIEGKTRKWPALYISALAKALDVTEEDLARAAGRIVATRAAFSVQGGGATFPAGGDAALVAELLEGMADEGVKHVLAAARFAAEHAGRDVSGGHGTKRQAG